LLLATGAAADFDTDKGDAPGALLQIHTQIHTARVAGSGYPAGDSRQLSMNALRIYDAAT
jgi:hypothetical protein